MTKVLDDSKGLETMAILDMYGKHFAQLYEGSMVGSGAVVFAVWGFVIAKQVPDRVVGSQVRLNPQLLAAILGESEKDVQSAIKFLCEPDPRSTTPDKDGRRLIKLGEFDYQVVNGAKYRAIRDEATRQQQNREAARRHRAKKKNGLPLPGEEAYVNATTEEQGESVISRHTPPANEVETNGK